MIIFIFIYDWPHWRGRGRDRTEAGEGEHARFLKVMDVYGQYIIRETVNNFKGVFDQRCVTHHCVRAIRDVAFVD